MNVGSLECEVLDRFPDDSFLEINLEMMDSEIRERGEPWVGTFSISRTPHLPQVSLSEP